MKNAPGSILITLISTSAMVGLSSCSAPGGGVAAAYGYTPTNAPGRLVARSADQTVRVAKVEQASTLVEAKTVALGGHVESMRLDQEDGEAHYSLRVPPSKLIAALDTYATFGRETKRSFRSTDLTDEIKNWKASESHLSKADLKATVAVSKIDLTLEPERIPGVMTVLGNTVGPVLRWLFR